MTIIWGFTFTSSVYFFNFLFDVLRFLIPSVFLFLYSSNNSRDVQNLRYLKISTIINFMLIGIFFFLPSPVMIINPTSLDFQISNMYINIMSVISNIFLLLSFGVLILLFGRCNKDLYGRYLLYTGIFFGIYFIIRLIIIQPIGYSLPYLPFALFSTGTFSALGQILTSILLGPLSMLSIIAIVFLIIHGYKNNEKYLIYAGFSYFISLAFIGYGQIPSTLYVLS